MASVDPFSALPQVSRTGTLTAAFHTHPSLHSHFGYQPERFSPGDIAFARGQNQLRTPLRIYLGAPSGRLFFYDPFTMSGAAGVDFGRVVK